MGTTGGCKIILYFPFDRPFQVLDFSPWMLISWIGGWLTEIFVADFVAKHDHEFNETFHSVAFYFMKKHIF